MISSKRRTHCFRTSSLNRDHLIRTVIPSPLDLSSGPPESCAGTAASCRLPLPAALLLQGYPNPAGSFRFLPPSETCAGPPNPCTGRSSPAWSADRSEGQTPCGGQSYSEKPGAPWKTEPEEWNRQ